MGFNSGFKGLMPENSTQQWQLWGRKPCNICTCACARARAHTHTHTHIYIYIYIYDVL